MQRNSSFVDIRLLARQGDLILQSSSSAHQHDNTLSTLQSSIYYPPNVTLETSQDTTLQSEIAPTVVLQRTNKEPWEPVSIQIVRYSKRNQSLFVYRNVWNYPMADSC